MLPTFKYVGANRIELDSSFAKIKINGLLANFLNNSKINIFTLDSKESFYLPSKIQPTKFIVIYTDIIESQYYGNIKSPILRYFYLVKLVIGKFKPLKKAGQFY